MNKKSCNKKNALSYSVYFVVIPFVYVFVKLVLAPDSEAREVYAFISAWWCALYLVSVLKLKVKDWRGILVISLVHAIVYHIFEYKEPAIDSFSLLVVILSALVLHFSPFIIHNFLVSVAEQTSLNYLEDEFREKLKKENSILINSIALCKKVIAPAPEGLRAFSVKATHKKVYGRMLFGCEISDRIRNLSLDIEVALIDELKEEAVDVIIESVECRDPINIFDEAVDSWIYVKKEVVNFEYDNDGSVVIENLKDVVNDEDFLSKNFEWLEPEKITGINYEEEKKRAIEEDEMIGRGEKVSDDRLDAPDMIITEFLTHVIHKEKDLKTEERTVSAMDVVDAAIFLMKNLYSSYVAFFLGYSYHLVSCDNANECLNVIRVEYEKGDEHLKELFRHFINEFFECFYFEKFKYSDCMEEDNLNFLKKLWSEIPI